MLYSYFGNSILAFDGLINGGTPNNPPIVKIVENNGNSTYKNKNFGFDISNTCSMGFWTNTDTGDDIVNFRIYKQEPPYYNTPSPKAFYRDDITLEIYYDLHLQTSQTGPDFTAGVDFSGAINVLKQAQRMHSFMGNNGNGFPLLQEYWIYSDLGELSNDSYSETFDIYQNFAKLDRIPPLIVIGGEKHDDNNNSNIDCFQWNNSVILHELTHLYQYIGANMSVNPTVGHTDHAGTDWHMYEPDICLKRAYLEAMATSLPTIIMTESNLFNSWDSPGHVDVNTLDGSFFITSFNDESDWYHDNNAFNDHILDLELLHPPWSGTSYPNRIVADIASFLWDLYDDIPEDLWHLDDSIMNFPISDIIDVTMNYSPRTMKGFLNAFHIAFIVGNDNLQVEYDDLVFSHMLEYTFSVNLIYHYPDDFLGMSIQEAIDSPMIVDTDAIIIAPGTYYENIVLTKDIHLWSEFVETSDITDIEQTIISAQDSNLPVISVHYKILDIVGITVTNGSTGIDCVDGNCTISNSIITSNGLGIAASDADYFRAEDTEISNNAAQGIHASFDGRPVYSNVQLVNCKIFNNGLTAYPDNNGIDIMYGSVDRCTIVNNVGFGIASASGLYLTNSIVRGNGSGSFDNGNWIIASYSNIEVPTGVFTGEGNINSDPLFTDEANNDFTLVWDTTDMSPCIDTGNPDEDYKDADGTPADMGYYTVEAHDYNIMSFNSGWNWCSLPALNIVTDNTVIHNKMTAYGFVDFEATNSVLNTIKWNYNGVDSYTYVGTPYFEWQSQTEKFYSVKGYKFLLNPGETGDMRVIGKREDPETDVTLYYPITWVGYFLEESRPDIFEALGEETVDKLISIQSQNWSFSWDGESWWGPGYSDIKYGEMVSLKLNSDYANQDPQIFQWVQPEGRTEDIPERPVAQHFIWIEESDYVSLCVLFDSVNRPEEVAVYAGDQCMGACAVTSADSLAQICAYILDENDQYDDSNLSFVFYFEDRSETQSFETYKIKEFDKDIYYSGVINTGNLAEDFYIVSMRKGDSSSIPPPLVMDMYSYPNPFNPSTHIRYDIPEASDVSLSIYNIKGQLVSTLVNDYHEAGNYLTEWKGTNTNGKSVATGVYFARLKAGSTVKTQKLMLLK
ncbi:MAG: T9SS type A sorting domain-containing protein [Candidatus Cloacimonetes bacterium]|nr:T9SS type A sorting domain-containing protein [Candidatus Cloacimonadota bacterium]